MSTEVTSGYKVTEVGVIPKDWEVVTLGDVIDYTKGFPFRSADYTTGGVRIIRVSDTTHDSISESAPIFISPITSESYSKWSLNEFDIIVSTVGSKPPMYDSMVGKAILVEKKFAGALLNQNAVIIRNKKNEKSIQVLVASHLRTKRYFSFVEGIFRGNANQASITLKDLFEFVVPMPVNHDERQAIAAALFDMDALISGLDQLIAKKRDIKQAAMQQLFTAQQRVSGFSGEWEVKPMRALGCTYGGLAGKTKSNFGHGDARYIPFMNVMTDTVIDPSWLEPVDVAPDEVQNLAKKGDLFFNGSSETPEEVGFCSVLLEDIPNLYLNSFCFGFRFKSSAKVNGLFFAYWFRSKPGRTAMSVLAQGATRYNIAKSAFMQLEIPQPSEEEQTAIASILSDMDGELATLKARCDKARQIKLGMMQELLTGRIRLK
jgi:type I restriction enzyme S subunit